MTLNPSIVLSGPGQARLDNRPIPQLRTATDVIVRVGFVGVCGSDVSSSVR
jgi:D-xylulose reductase